MSSYDRSIGTTCCLLICPCLTVPVSRALAPVRTEGRAGSSGRQSRSGCVQSAPLAADPDGTLLARRGGQHRLSALTVHVQATVPRARRLRAGRREKDAVRRQPGGARGPTASATRDALAGTSRRPDVPTRCPGVPASCRTGVPGIASSCPAGE